jgi:hypothetical protein
VLCVVFLNAINALRIMRSIFLCLSLSLSLCCGTYAQGWKPGFDKHEYIELLKVNAMFGDSTFRAKMPAPSDSKLWYRSPVVGLENRWSLYLRKDSVAIICIRGTTASKESWMANFYSAMVPATGILRLSDTDTFRYHLADNPKAGVHVGWLLSTAYLAKTIVPEIDSFYKSGIKRFIITGHSQGGAIAYLMTAYLYQLRKENVIAGDIQFKTYCSAGPKPGNLFFAYDYEHTTSGGWAYNVVNTADWVPETPVTIQTLHDFNNTNVFAVAPDLFKKQKFPVNLIGKYVFNRLSKPGLKAQRVYEKYLGHYVSKQVIKQLPSFKIPDYNHSTNFVRTGNYVILYADSTYYKKYPDSKSNVFIHHLFQPYLYLAERLPE